MSEIKINPDSGSLAIFAAIRRASSRVSNFAAALSKTGSDTIAAATRAIATAVFANTESNDTVAATARQNSAHGSFVEQADGISAQAKATVTGTLAATEQSDVGSARIGGAVLSVVTGDGAAASGTAFTPLRQIVHYSE